jgi:adenylate cyclase
MARLVIKSGPLEGTVFEIKQDKITLGRAETCDIILVDNSVSRQHAIITKQGEQYTLIDNQSRNGSFVNGVLVTTKNLSHGDTIRIGQTLLEFVDKEQVAVQISEGSKFEAKEEVTLIKPLASGRKKGNQLLLDERRLFTLYQAGQVITSILELNVLLNKIIELILEIINAERAFLIFWDEKLKRLIPKVSKYRREKDKYQRVTISKSLINYAISNQVSILSADAMTDPRFKQSMSVVDYRIRSVMCVPLISKNKVIGVIHVDNPLRAGLFKEEDLDLLSAIASQAAVAIENAQLYENIQRETQIRSNLQRYLSPAVVEEIIQKGEPIKPGGIRKEVTVIYADIRGFTSLSAQLTPDEVMSLLNRYYFRMSEIIFQFEGTLDKFIGDCIMALFGAPISHRDDPLRAVKTAIQMQSELKKLRQQWQQAGEKTFEIGIGINTGEVVVGNVGSLHRLEYTAIGDTVNLGQRLEAAAKPSQILISDSTYHHVKNTIATKKLPPLYVKGRERPLVVYEVCY